MLWHCCRTRLFCIRLDKITTKKNPIRVSHTIHNSKSTSNIRSNKYYIYIYYLLSSESGYLRILIFTFNALYLNFRKTIVESNRNFKHWCVLLPCPLLNLRLARSSIVWILVKHTFAYYTISYQLLCLFLNKTLTALLFLPIIIRILHFNIATFKVRCKCSNVRTTRTSKQSDFNSL